MKLQQHELVLQNYANIEQASKEARGFWHDTGNHFQTLMNLLQKDLTDQTNHSEQYLGNLMDKLADGMLPVNSGHPVVDAVLNQKYHAARAQKIDIKIKAVLPGNMKIVDIDLGSLLSNILDNAIEAAEKIPDPALRYINAEIMPENDNFVFTVSNSIGQQPVSRKGVYLSSKPKVGKAGKAGQEHGLGLRNVEEIAGKYDGQVIIKVSETEFIISVFLKMS